MAASNVLISVTTNVVTTERTIQPGGCRITFKNVGMEMATINGVIDLYPNNSISFGQIIPNAQISTNFSISFPTGSPTTILVIEESAIERIMK